MLFAVCDNMLSASSHGLTFMEQEMTFCWLKSLHPNMTEDDPKMYPERKQEPRSNHIHCWWAAHDHEVLNFLNLVC